MDTSADKIARYDVQESKRSPSRNTRWQEELIGAPDKRERNADRYFSILTYLGGYREYL